MPYHISPNGSAGGRLSAYAVLRRHKPFNQHYFRPYLFWRYLKKSCLSHFPNKAQISHYRLLPRLRSLNRTQGQHRLSQGQEKVALYARIVNLCIITVFLLFLVYGIKPILLSLVVQTKNLLPNLKN